MSCYYEIIAGSRCYGLNIDGSDIDLCRVSDTWDIRGHNGQYHLIQVPRSEFADRAMLLKETPVYIQWLFPYEVRKPGEVWEFLLKERENIVSAARKRVWDLHICAADGMALYPDHYYDRVPKRLAYSTLFYDTLARYASGIPFAQAIRPEEDMRQVLLAMRRHELSLDEALSYNREAQSRAKAISLFYDKEPDWAYLEKVKSSLLYKLGL